MANTNIGISNFVFSQSPFFVRNDHPNFVRFIEAYYEYLEQEGNTIERAKGFRNALDVDRSIDLYTEQLYNQFLNSIPNDVLADKNLIIKHIKDFYRARGTEKSIKFLMSILYDEDVNFYYPKRDILKASDGKWYQEKSLKVFDIQVNNVADPGIFTVKNFTGRQIRGATSNATATVESVDVYYETGVIVKELKISNQVRDFKAGERILSTFEEEGQIKDISANVFSGIIVRVDLLSRGNNYVVGQTANVESNTGSGAVIVVSEVSRAAIKTISPADGGAGFQNSNVILISGGLGSGANANVASVNTDEEFHPNSYNIVITLIGALANIPIGAIAGSNNETSSYPYLDPVLIKLPPNTSNLTANTISGTLVNNLMFSRAISNSNVFFQTGDSLNVFNVSTNTNYVITITSSSPGSNSIVFTPTIAGNLRFERVTVLKAPFSAWSNLTISCGTGASVNVINLSSWKANSNVFFETYDNIFCFGTNVMITKSNTISRELTVSPGLPGPLTNQPFQVIKKPNAKMIMANTLSYFVYGNTGPIQRVIVLAGGNNYTGNISLTAEANTRVRNLGILGKMIVTNPGTGYVAGDEIEFINLPWEPFLSDGLGTGARGYVAAVNATGAIESVKFKQMPGYPVGGTGYNMSRLPRANVISATGAGANVVVTAVLGDGERLVSVSDDIGAILKLDIISGGSGYATVPTINLKGFGSGTAQAEATIVQGVYSYPGRYLNDDGHLSGFNFLQDGKYYHNYSYVVRIKQAISRYRKALKDLVHPIGMSLFGEYTSVDNGETINLQVRSSGTTENTVMKLTGYRINNNVITYTRNAHGFTVNTAIYSEYVDGTEANVVNGILTVVSVMNVNSYNVSVANANTIPVGTYTGNVYVGRV